MGAVDRVVGWGGRMWWARFKGFNSFWFDMSIGSER